MCNRNLNRNAKSKNDAKQEMVSSSDKDREGSELRSLSISEHVYGVLGKTLLVWCLLSIAISTALAADGLPILGKFNDQSVSILSLPVTFFLQISVLWALRMHLSELSNQMRGGSRLPGIEIGSPNDAVGVRVRKFIFFGYVIFPTITIFYFWVQFMQHGYTFRDVTYGEGLAEVLVSTAGMWEVFSDQCRYKAASELTYFPIFQPWAYTVFVVYSCFRFIQTTRLLIASNK